jgi:hypothetical protein
VPTIAITTAMITAGKKPLISKSEKILSASLIISAVTTSLITKESKPKVTIFNGSLNKKPTVTFNIPITKATKIAVVKFLIFTVGRIYAIPRIVPASRSSCKMKFIIKFCWGKIKFFADKILPL